MKRRDFMTALVGATAWVAAARAQEQRRMIGVLGSATYNMILPFLSQNALSSKD